MSEVPMPDWAPAEGPWCLKRWLPLPGKAYDLCLLSPGHEGDCRTIHGGWQNDDNALYLGDTPPTS